MGYSEVRQETGDRRQETTAADLTPDSRLLTPQKRSPLDESPEPTLDTRQLLIDPLDLFLKDFHDKTATNRAILDHLLHQTFANDAGGSEPESDLILDPDADDATVDASFEIQITQMGSFSMVHLPFPGLRNSAS